MVIERIGDEIVIKIPASVGAEGLQRLINYLIYREVTSESQARQEEVDELAKEINKSWWELFYGPGTRNSSPA